MSQHCFVNTCSQKCCNILGLCPSLVPISEYKDCYYYYENGANQHSAFGSSVLDWVLIITVCLVIIAVAISLFRHCRKQDEEISHGNQYNSFGQRDSNGKWKSKQKQTSHFAASYKPSEPSHRMAQMSTRRNLEHQQPVVHYAADLDKINSHKMNSNRGNPYYKYDQNQDKLSQKSEVSSKRSLISYYNKKLMDYGTHANPKIAEVQSNHNYYAHEPQITYHAKYKEEEHTGYPQLVYHERKHNQYHRNEPKYTYHEKSSDGNEHKLNHNEEIQYPKIYH